MAVRPRGVVGSALATAVLGTFFYRSVGTLAPASGAESNQPGRALSAVTEAAQKGSTKSAFSAKAQRFDGPWIASQRHFAGPTPCISVTSPEDEKNQSLGTIGDDFQRWCVPDSETVKAMIAVVPDPVQTHLALRFDRAID